MDLSRDLAERRQRLASLVQGRNLRPGDPYADELLASKKEIDKDLERLQGFVDELLELGVEPKNLEEGLIDFPARLQGSPVYLCWQYGEPEVMYYHERDSGFAGRKRIPADRVSAENEAERERSCV